MTQANAIPTLPLRGDVTIPQLGFGVFQVPPQDTVDVVTRALLAGYRHIDTAAGYRNEAGVGQAGNSYFGGRVTSVARTSRSAVPTCAI